MSEPTQPTSAGAETPRWRLVLTESLKQMNMAHPDVAYVLNQYIRVTTNALDAAESAHTALIADLAKATVGVGRIHSAAIDVLRKHAEFYRHNPEMDVYLNRLRAALLPPPATQEERT